MDNLFTMALGLFLILIGIFVFILAKVLDTMIYRLDRQSEQNDYEKHHRKFHYNRRSF